MTQSASSWSEYLRERFPIAGVGLISVGFALLAIGQRPMLFDQRWFIQVSMLALVFAAFLLRQRVTDEFKDKHHDDVNFPTRPFQQGRISARSLICMGALALVIEIVAVLLLGGSVAFGWYLPILLYSMLMAREFGVSKWLGTHFTLYFLLHEIIFILFALWISQILWAAPLVKAIARATAFTMIMMSVEIARKYELRRDSKGRVVPDTYLAVWGRSYTLVALEGLVMTAGLLLAYAESSLVFAVIAAAVALCLNLFTLRDRQVQALVAINLLALSCAGVVL
jgi:4-hydroxybenzoate polyprenyltransferase